MDPGSPLCRSEDDPRRDRPVKTDSLWRNSKAASAENTFRERRPVYRAYPRGCGLINDLFDSPPPPLVRGCLALNVLSNST